MYKITRQNTNFGTKYKNLRIVFERFRFKLHPGRAKGLVLRVPNEQRLLAVSGVQLEVSGLGQSLQVVVVSDVASADEDERHRLTAVAKGSCSFQEVPGLFAFVPVYQLVGDRQFVQEVLGLIAFREYVEQIMYTELCLIPRRISSVNLFIVFM